MPKETPSASFPMGLAGSELWAPILKVGYDGIIMGSEGFRIRGPYERTIGSTLDLHRILDCSIFGTWTSKA